METLTASIYIWEVRISAKVYWHHIVLSVLQPSHNANFSLAKKYWVAFFHSAWKSAVHPLFHLCSHLTQFSLAKRAICSHLATSEHHPRVARHSNAAGSTRVPPCRHPDHDLGDGRLVFFRSDSKQRSNCLGQYLVTSIKKRSERQYSAPCCCQVIVYAI